ncbi:hypothetical protein GCM10017688_12930 [Streptomyces ramulosus]
MTVLVWAWGDAGVGDAGVGTARRACEGAVDRCQGRGIGSTAGYEALIEERGGLSTTRHSFQVSGAHRIG